MCEDRKNNHELSENQSINKLLGTTVDQLRSFLEKQENHIRELTAIGRALSAQHDTATMLEMILNQACRFTSADGGTIYMKNRDSNELVFHVVHTETLKIHMGGTSGNPVTLPNIPLFLENGNPNLTNVSAYVANTLKVLNISDVYTEKGFNFNGTKDFDASLNYRSKSMLVIPMQDHEDEVIGVLQLINSKNPLSKEIVPFSSDSVELATALASQAAVVLTQQRLIREMEELFQSFTRAIATAIDKKSKYTSGHIGRVAELTMMIAEKINESKEGPLSDVVFTTEEMEELRMAAWMHDTGKITIPEHIMDKSNKLDSVFNRIELLKTRWEAKMLSIQLDAEKAKLAMVEKREDPDKIKEIDESCKNDLLKLKSDLDFIIDINGGSEFFSDENLNRLKNIAEIKYRLEGNEFPLLNESEFYNLSIPKGTLTNEERDIINSHSLMTIKILEKLPWPKKLSRVPAIAGAHHEKLDGSGYPRRLSGDQISLQSRIMAVADIFEALLATDRPYKKPLTLSKTINIMNSMVNEKHIDKNVMDLFINTGLHLEYAKKFLDPSQIDLTC